jgi:hypothetical protein
VISTTQRDAIKTQSIFSRRAYDAAMLALGGFTSEQLTAKHPGFDLAGAMKQGNRMNANVVNP